MSGGLSAARIGRVWLSKRKAPTSAPRAMKRQRIGKYPQITQITQILFQILCAPSWDRIKGLRSKLFAPKLIKRPLSWPLALR
jgi:hypothetical protein